MNRLLTKRLGTMICSLLFISSASFSQLDKIDFLRVGASDGMKYAEAYITPWANAFGAAMNGGWYNTAKPHKFGGFDITAGVSFGFVPSSATTFDVSKIGLSSLSGTGTASTIAGPNKEGPTLSATAGGITLAEFKAPPGTNFKMVPIPMAQIGLGLPLGTEVKGRFIPKINIGDGNISLWGVGLLHSIIQYFPGNDLLPFDISLFGGYTKLKGNVPVSLQPKAGAPGTYTTYNTATSFNDQNMGVDVSAMNIGVIGSLNLPIITFYGGLGYSKTATSFALTGNYPLPRVNTAVSTTEAVYEDAGVVKNFPPVDIESFSGLRANIGFRLKFSVVTIHADYTRAQYNVISTGFGISFR